MKPPRHLPLMVIQKNPGSINLKTWHRSSDSTWCQAIYWKYCYVHPAYRASRVFRFGNWKLYAFLVGFPTVEGLDVVASLSNELVFIFWPKWPAKNTWNTTSFIHPSSCSYSIFFCPSFLWIIFSPSTNLNILWDQNCRHEYEHNKLFHRILFLLLAIILQANNC